MPADSADVNMTVTATLPGSDTSTATVALGAETAVSIDVIRPPVIFSPAPSATVTAATMFAGTGGVNATTRFYFNNAARQILLVTSKNTLTLGDLAAYGIAVPPGGDQLELPGLR